jgi:hypothetical protein
VTERTALGIYGPLHAISVISLVAVVAMKMELFA